MSLNHYLTTINLFQIGSKELDKTRIITSHLKARDFDHLEIVAEKYLHTRFGVNHVEFFYSGENLSIKY
jgi:hypothetical protein